MSSGRPKKISPMCVKDLTLPSVGRHNSVMTTTATPNCQGDTMNQSISNYLLEEAAKREEREISGGLNPDDMECLDCGAQGGEDCFMDCKA